MHFAAIKLAQLATLNPRAVSIRNYLDIAWPRLCSPGGCEVVANKKGSSQNEEYRFREVYRGYVGVI